MADELISFCIPCMNRTHDLRETMPHLIRAANASPPVEIAVLDYSSQDDLAAYMEEMLAGSQLNGGGWINYTRYTGRDYYHMTHAWNLAVLASSGEYIAIMGADAIPVEDYVVEARKLIADGCVWMRGRRYKGILICAREEFIAAGGYDERFELYGNEDRDLDSRLQRRGTKFGKMPSGLVSTIRTQNRDKVRNYRQKLSRREMSHVNKRMRLKNEEKGVLVANEGVEWGQWNRVIASNFGDVTRW